MSVSVVVCCSISSDFYSILNVSEFLLALRAAQCLVATKMMSNIALNLDRTAMMWSPEL